MTTKASIEREQKIERMLKRAKYIASVGEQINLTKFSREYRLDYKTAHDAIVGAGCGKILSKPGERLH